MAAQIFPYGTALTVVWHLSKPDGTDFDISGYTYRVYYRTGNKETEANGSHLTASGNTISIVIPATEPSAPGEYALRLVLYQNNRLFCTLNYNAAFVLSRRLAQDLAVETQQEEVQVVHLYTVAEFYLLTPVVPTVGADDYWYVNGTKVMDENGDYIYANHTMDYDDETNSLIIDKDRVDSEGHSIQQTVPLQVGIESVTQTETSYVSGGINVVSVDMTNGHHSEFTVVNGQKGERGPEGVAGATGPQGIAGATGATGPKGDKGDKGDSGVSLGEVALTVSLDETETGKALDASAMQTIPHWADEQQEIEDVPSNYYTKPQVDALLNSQQTGINNALSAQDHELDVFGTRINDVEDAVRNITDDHPTIINNGTINNAPNNEDITTDGNNLLMFADRSGLNGMGYVILRKDKTFAEQVTKTNTIYEIRYDFDLDDATVVIPVGSVLQFNGGSLQSGKLTLNNGYCRIVDAIASDLCIQVSGSDLEIVRGKFSYDDLLTPIICESASRLKISDSEFGGSVSGSFIVYSAGATVTRDIFCDIDNCNITGSVSSGSYGTQTLLHALRFVGNEALVAYSGTCRINNTRILLSAGHPYSCIGWQNVEVTGGEFTSDSESACNLYGNNSASIIGGYYHDMKRGATIGGKRGQDATVSNTINKNIYGGGGVAIDLADDSAQATYSEGHAVAFGNIVDNAYYGMFIQGHHISITNNVIKGGSLSSNTGIRVNCFDQNSEDAVVITGNLVNYSEAFAYPIFLGENTVAHISNNLLLTKTFPLNYGTDAEILPLDTGIISSANVSSNLEIKANYNLIIIDSSVSQNFNLRLFGSGYNGITGLRERLVNNSNYTVTLLPRANTTTTIVGPTILYPHSSLVLDFLDNNVISVSEVEDVRYGTTRPTNKNAGYCFFDSEAGKPLWWTGSAWVDATGATVE